jgi:hypothetical protein
VFLRAAAHCKFYFYLCVLCALCGKFCRKSGLIYRITDGQPGRFIARKNTGVKPIAIFLGVFNENGLMVAF